jgi:hypothetical protein
MGWISFVYRIGVPVVLKNVEIKKANKVLKEKESPGKKGGGGGIDAGVKADERADGAQQSSLADDLRAVHEPLKQWTFSRDSVWGLGIWYNKYLGLTAWSLDELLAHRGWTLAALTEKGNRKVASGDIVGPALPYFSSESPYAAEVGRLQHGLVVCVIEKKSEVAHVLAFDEEGKMPHPGYVDLLDVDGNQNILDEAVPAGSRWSVRARLLREADLFEPEVYGIIPLTQTIDRDSDKVGTVNQNDIVRARKVEGNRVEVDLVDIAHFKPGMRKQARQGWMDIVAVDGRSNLVRVPDGFDEESGEEDDSPGGLRGKTKRRMSNLKAKVSSKDEPVDTGPDYAREMQAARADSRYADDWRESVDPIWGKKLYVNKWTGATQWSMPNVPPAITRMVWELHVNAVELRKDPDLCDKLQDRILKLVATESELDLKFFGIEMSIHRPPCEPIEDWLPKDGEEAPKSVWLAVTIMSSEFESHVKQLLQDIVTKPNFTESLLSTIYDTPKIRKALWEKVWWGTIEIEQVMRDTEGYVEPKVKKGRKKAAPVSQVKVEEGTIPEDVENVRAAARALRFVKQERLYVTKKALW